MAAPIAQFDDEWENFSSFSLSSNMQQQVADGECNSMVSESSDNLENSEFSELLNYESMEDLVHSFDEKLASCFKINNNDADNNPSHLSIFPLEAFNNNKLWKKLTDNFGLIEPLNWETSQVRKLHIPALCLPFHTDKEIDSTDKLQCCKIEGIAESDAGMDNHVDYHEMIEYNVYTEGGVNHDIDGGTDRNTAMQTADEVIEELEEIIQDAVAINAALDYKVQDETGIIFDETVFNDNVVNDSSNLHCRPSLGSASSLEESVRASELKCMTLSQLNVANEDMEAQVALLSTELLVELNKRDELQYEIEVKNSLISKVLEVQYMQEKFSKSVTTAPKKLSNLRRSATTNSLSNQGKYLTTIIPCTKGEILTTDNLQSLIKILDAMKTDSSEVPSLLTSYILQVVCPAPVGSHTFKL